MTPEINFKFQQAIKMPLLSSSTEIEEGAMVRMEVKHAKMVTHSTQHTSEHTAENTKLFNNISLLMHAYHIHIHI